MSKEMSVSESRKQQEEKTEFRLQVNPEDLANASNGSRAAFEKITASCRSFVMARHGNGITYEELEDLISDGIVEEWENLREPRFRNKGLKQLKTKLDTYKKRTKRRHSQFIDKEVGGETLDIVAYVETVDFFGVVLGYILACMGDALEILGQRAHQMHDLIVIDYKLEEEGFVLHGAPLPTAKSRKRALRRARQRFNQHLETLISAAIERKEGDKDALCFALEVVRGGKIKNLAKALVEIGNDPPWASHLD